MGDALRALAGPAKLLAPELLLVADLVIPAMNGRELGRELRKGPVGSRGPEDCEQICRWRARRIMTTMEAPVLSTTRMS